MNFANMTVLLVDDETANRKLMSLILQQLGSPHLLEASNGKEALEVYRREQPDLVILDVDMPVMDGLETLGRLREECPESVIVMLTSNTSRNLVERAIGLGADGYIRRDSAKEVIAEQLQEVVDACFESDAGPTKPEAEGGGSMTEREIRRFVSDAAAQRGKHFTVTTDKGIFPGVRLDDYFSVEIPLRSTLWVIDREGVRRAFDFAEIVSLSFNQQM